MKRKNNKQRIAEYNKACDKVNNAIAGTYTIPYKLVLLGRPKKKVNFDEYEEEI